MKQGSGKSSSASKTEPRSMAINPKAVADIGIQQVRTKPISMTMGRGAANPGPLSCTAHKSGSQGKH